MAKKLRSKIVLDISYGVCYNKNIEREKGDLEMTYEEAYMKCETLEELEEMANKDIKTAKWLNPDRIKVIVKVAEEVANLKFKGGFENGNDVELGLG